MGTSVASTMSIKVISLVLAMLAVGVLAARHGRSFRLSIPPPSTGPVPVEGGGLGDVGPVVVLDPFLVSEVEGEGEHVSKVTFEVEVNDAQGRDIFKSRTSQIRSAILTVLADTRLNDIGDSEDLGLLKKMVQGRIQSLLPDHVVRRVLITEFLSL